ncbi:MAG: LLM class F420-dependent oxidoreductase [Acidobacteriota bacterium]
MKFGFGVPNIGPLGSADSVKSVATRAEELGYDSLWVIERLLYPVNPKTPYPVTPDGSWPDVYRHVLDPLETLTFVSAHTSTIALGTSVLDIPYYNPVMLARRISTLDRFSGGRVRLGLGLGWAQDEYDAVGATFQNRGRLADEFLAVLKAIWGTNPVEFRGDFYTVPQSFIDSKPVQKPHPPIYLAAFAPVALKRIARAADGWNVVALPPDAMAQMFGSVKEMAEAEGRDPASLKMVVRANVELLEEPRAKDGMIFTGTFEQIEEDVEACRRVGAHEVFFDPTFSPGAQSLDRWVELMEQFRTLA